MTDRRSLADEFKDRGLSAEGRFPCPECGKMLPAFAIVDTSDLPALKHNAACGQCIQDAERKDDGKPRRIKNAGWDGEDGKAIRARRNRLLDSRAWTIRADSPLTKACRKAWGEWLLSLHWMTMDSTPETWVFPEEPELDYMGKAEARKRLHSQTGD